MKTLYLFRHGKSDWEADFARDFNRPLAKRGRKAAGRMGFFLAIADSLPDQWVSSPAMRARRTAERAHARAGTDAPLLFDERLYHGDANDLIAVAQEQPEEAASVLLAGHEPTWSEAASLLIGGGDLRFPTAALARIDLHVGAWEDAGEDTGELIWFVTPRLLKPVLKPLRKQVQ